MVEKFHGQTPAGEENNSPNIEYERFYGNYEVFKVKIAFS